MKAATSAPGQRSMLGYIAPATSKRKPTSATGVNTDHYSTGVNPDQSATGVNPDRSESPATLMSYSLQKAKFFEDTIAEISNKNTMPAPSVIIKPVPKFQKKFDFLNTQSSSQETDDVEYEGSNQLDDIPNSDDPSRNYDTNSNYVF